MLGWLARAFANIQIPLLILNSTGLLNISLEAKPKPTVVVIGGGVSGLIAATTLRNTGEFFVTLLEADDHIGGRVKSRKFGEHFVEFGAEYVHGEKDNRVFELLQPYGILATDEDNTAKNKEMDGIDIFATQHGEIMDPSYAHKIEELLTIIDNSSVSDLGKNPWIQYALNRKYKSLGEYLSSVFGFMDKLEPFHPRKSIRNATLDWFHRMTNIEFSQDNWFLISKRNSGEQFVYAEGNRALLFKSNSTYSSLLRLILGRPVRDASVDIDINIPDWINLGKEVDKIIYTTSEDTKVVVRCTDGTTYSVDHVISTTSLGVLKEKHETLFSPKLSAKKELAIQNIGYGTVDKIFLEFETAWWEQIPGFRSVNFLWDNPDGVAINANWLANSTRAQLLQEHNGIPVWYRSLVSFVTVNSGSHSKALQGWISGASARFMETLDLDQVTKTSMTVLRTFLKNKFQTIPDPIRSARSTWYTNPYTRGSYSFRTVESERLDVWARDLAAPILNIRQKPIVTFAGEATHRRYFSTVNGAYDSGVREANRIINFYAK